MTGARGTTNVRQLPATITVVGRDKIEQSEQPSLLPVLNELVPGLFVTARGVMGYGVSGGASGDINLHGLSGSFARVIVLIDGRPLYMGLMGHPISDICQSYLAERVEVLHGPASVLYGSNAMGGVINIVTRRRREDGINTSVNAGYGSYNTLQSEATNFIHKGRFTSTVSGSYNRTDGHRSDMGFEQFGGYAGLGYELSDTWKIDGDVNVTHFNASHPGAVGQPLRDADQRVTRGAASIGLRNDYGATSGALNFFYNWGHHWINDGYSVAPGSTAGPLPYRFISDDNMMGISWYQSARLFNGNRLTAGVDYFRFGGKAYNKFVEGDKMGQETLIVDKKQDEIAGYLSTTQDFGRWITLNAGLRADHHSDMGTEWIPQAGVVFHLPSSADLKLSASKGFRYPTIREMYMFPPKNPDLKPESMWNYELSFAQRLLNGALTYSINAYYIKGKNLIVTVPRQGAIPLNMNIGKVENAGVDLQAAYRASRKWSFNANYSYLHQKSPVTGAPEHKLYTGVTFTPDRFGYLWGCNT